MTIRGLDFSVDSVTVNRRLDSVFVVFVSLKCTEAVTYCFADQASLVKILGMACLTQTLVENGG